MNNTHDNPLISLIIPCYNGEKTLSRAVDSVTSQPCFDLIELIIVNDGSKDGSGAIIDAYAAKYQNIREIYKENGGVSSARNLGMEQATGKYLAFLDADDWWEPEFLDDGLAKDLSENEFDIYSFAYKSVTTSLKYEKTHNIKSGTLIYEKYERGRFNWYSFCSFLYKRGFIIANGLRFLPTKINEDHPFVEMAHYLAGGIKRIDRPIFAYWSNPSSVIHSRDPLIYYNEYIKSQIILCEWYAKYGLDVCVDGFIIEAFSKIIDELCIYHSYSETCDIVSSLNHIDIIIKYENYKLPTRIFKTVNSWITAPYRHWLKANVITKPKLRFRRFLYRNPHLRTFPDMILYKGLMKYKQTSRNIGSSNVCRG